MPETLVYFDTMAADERAGNDHLALHAVRLDAQSDGTTVPVVSAAEFARFISAWSRNDPNGTWNPAGIAEGDGALIYDDECGRDMWRVVGIAADGAALYGIDWSGWQA